MAKADLHVHSCYSDRPSEWFLQRMGVAESYTEPERIYRLAKERGMSFVTITDHDAIGGVLRLKEKHPADVITGVEVTTCFPEDHCKIHVLVYGLDADQFTRIQGLRSDLYALRDYLKECGLACSVAHATFAVNSRLSLEHLEKLVLLFDVFEGINGGRSKRHNDTWMGVLRSLTPERMHEFERKYRIEPWGAEPWIKGFTGGSDDHAGLYIGRSYTIARAETPEEFLDAMRLRGTRAEGRHNDYQSLAFTAYKVAYDYACSKGKAGGKSALTQVSEMVFSDKRVSPATKVRIKALDAIRKRWGRREMALLAGLVERLADASHAPIETRLNVAYSELTAISDELLSRVAQLIRRAAEEGDLAALLKSVYSMLPGMAVLAPFLATLRYMSQSKGLLEELGARMDGGMGARQRRVLWFSDTVNDLNGVAVTLKSIGWLANRQGWPLRLVTSLLPEEMSPEVPPNVMNLPVAASFDLPAYESYSIKIPSVLRSLELIQAYEPDLIYISTPGPIGLLGLLAARLLNVRCVAIYHTDFARQATAIMSDEAVGNVLERYTHWFYATADEILVPTQAYIDVLRARGLPGERMRVFPRGIDADEFRPRASGRVWLRQRLGIVDGPVLLYVGRISRDKNLEFLAAVYRRLLDERPDLNLVLVGDGPYRAELAARLRGCPRAYFTGRVPHELLPELYSGADLLVFPSETDTFGMAVLEAQACGLPALVSDVGGPQEIVVNGVTGCVASAIEANLWCSRVASLLRMAEERPADYCRMRGAARDHVLREYNWDRVVRELITEPADTRATSRPHDVMALPHTQPLPAPILLA